MFTFKEWRTFFLVVIVTAIAFAFDDGQETFSWGFWLTNLVQITLMVFISLLIHELAHKWAAKRHGFHTEYLIWGIQDWSIHPRAAVRGSRKKPFPTWITIFGKRFMINSFPIGVVLSLLVTLISNGKLFFLALAHYSLLLKRPSRFGQPFVEVTDYEEAKIALVGPLAHILLMLIASFFNTYNTLDTFIFINGALALFYMIPIHKLDGAKVFFGSPVLYIFSLVFMIAMVFLVQYLSPIPLLIMSGIAAVLAAIIFYYLSYFR